MALNRALRLRKRSDFQRVRQQGRSISSRLLVLAWTPNDIAQVRIGFVVSKRISKLAVERNYIKRLLGEAIRPRLHALSGNAGWDIVLTARAPITSADLCSIRQDIVTLLRRSHLLEPEIKTV